MRSPAGLAVECRLGELGVRPESVGWGTLEMPGSGVCPPWGTAGRRAGASCPPARGGVRSAWGDSASVEERPGLAGPGCLCLGSVL